MDNYMVQVPYNRLKELEKIEELLTSNPKYVMYGNRGKYLQGPNYFAIKPKKYVKAMLKEIRKLSDNSLIKDNRIKELEYIVKGWESDLRMEKNNKYIPINKPKRGWKWPKW